jgi:flagellar biosynthesis chaperone FliJ
MKLPKYPLEQLVLIKKRRLEEAQKKLKEKKQILEKEQEKLKKLEEECQKMSDHKKEKIDQLDEELNQGTTSSKIDIANKYLKVVEEQLSARKRKVVEQDKIVKTAFQQVELARSEMLKKQQDVEKLEIHREEWKKGVLKEIEIKEAIESDEIGSAKFSSLKRERERQEQALSQKKTRKRE